MGFKMSKQRLYASLLILRRWGLFFRTYDHDDLYRGLKRNACGV